MSTRPICPDCAQGKHTICNGEAWDLDTDALTICRCPTCCEKAS